MLLELLRGLLDLIESLALALELVDPLLGARDRISFVVLEDETDMGHGIFISFFGSHRQTKSGWDQSTLSLRHGQMDRKKFPEWYRYASLRASYPGRARVPT